MSLIIWVATREGLLVSSQQQNPSRIFHVGTTLLAVLGESPALTEQLTTYLKKNTIDLHSEVHVEALRAVVCQHAQGEVTVSFGQRQEGISGVVFMTVQNQQLTGFEIRQYNDQSEAEYIPLGDQSEYFLEKVASHPNYLKTLRQKKIRYVRDLNLDTARKIAREMIRDTSLAANQKAPEVDSCELRIPTSGDAIS